VNAVTQGGLNAAVETLDAVYDKLETWYDGSGETPDWPALLREVKAVRRRLESIDASPSSAGPRAA
jgi:hypothetical protein